MFAQCQFPADPPSRKCSHHLESQRLRAIKSRKKRTNDPAMPLVFEKKRSMERQASMCETNQKRMKTIFDKNGEVVGRQMDVSYSLSKSATVTETQMISEQIIGASQDDLKKHHLEITNEVTRLLNSTPDPDIVQDRKELVQELQHTELFKLIKDGKQMFYLRQKMEAYLETKMAELGKSSKCMCFFSCNFLLCLMFFLIYNRPQLDHSFD